MQTHAITALLKGSYQLAIADTSPLLCAFYANYYSNYAFPQMLLAIQEWEQYLGKEHRVQVYNFLIELTSLEYQHRYQADGRYETLEQCLKMQSVLKQWLCDNAEITVIQKGCCTAEYILQQVGISL
jgi:hypothetical protein